MMSAACLRKPCLIGFAFLATIRTVAQPGPSAKQPGEVTYETDAYLDKASGFSRNSKIAISVEPNTRTRYGEELNAIELVARRQGLKCAALGTAEFVVVVRLQSAARPKNANGYGLYSIVGKAYRLSGSGTKRDEKVVWECSAVGGKEGAWEKVTDLTAGWAEADTVISNLVSSIGTGEDASVDSEGFFSMPTAWDKCGFPPGNSWPVPVLREVPIYPREMRKQGVPGEATIDFIVERDGGVTNVKMRTQSNFWFGSAGCDCVKRWKFKPALKDGVPVRMRMSVPLFWRAP